MQNKSREVLFHPPGKSPEKDSRLNTTTDSPAPGQYEVTDGHRFKAPSVKFNPVGQKELKSSKFKDLFPAPGSYDVNAS